MGKCDEVVAEGRSRVEDGIWVMEFLMGMAAGATREGGQRDEGLHPCELLWGC